MSVESRLAYCAYGRHSVPRNETTTRLVKGISRRVCTECEKELAPIEEATVTTTAAEEPLAKDITIGDKYRPAMEIQTKEEADAYFQKLVEHMVVRGHTRPEAERIERSNLGYFAGYYGEETRERVERLFDCEHPIFGKFAKYGSPTFEEALNRGIKAGTGEAPILG